MGHHADPHIDRLIQLRMRRQQDRHGHAEACDVVVVGGGPAGLLAAHHLGAAGLTVTVVEAAHRAGGRMAAEHRDGFRLDRASQPLLCHRPELTRLPRPLPLHRLTGGVLLHGAGGQVHRVGAAVAERGTAPYDEHWLRAGPPRLSRIPAPRAGRAAAPELTAAAALRAPGIPRPIAENALRPLLAALLGDPDLASSSRLGELRLRALARRGLGLPPSGTDALPALLSGALPEAVTVRTGRRALAVSTTAVETERAGGGRRSVIRCRAVVVATGAAEAARLLPGLRAPRHLPATVLHHAVPAPAPEPPGGGGAPALIVDAASRGPLAHTLAASAADPGRAPAGWALVTSVVLGPRAAEPPELLDKAARPQLSELYDAPADDWELLAAHHDPQAVPLAAPPYTGARGVRLLDGLYVCGDHRDAPGLPGDLASARRAAEALLADAGLDRPGARPATPAA